MERDKRGSVKALKIVRFCSNCGLIFILAAVTSGILRAKYSLVPQIRTEYAYLYVSNVDQYSFLQYNQSDSDRGRSALLEYVSLLQRVRSENIIFPLNTLHRDFGLTYLRLYRLESADGNSVKAEEYMMSAQREWSELGWKADDLSTEALTKLIEKREAYERALYNASGVSTSAQQAKPRPQKAVARE